MAIDTEDPATREGPVRHAGRMVEEAKAFTSGISAKANDFAEALDLGGRVQRHPIATVCGALGVGYVLGGGLFTSTTRRLIRIGVRLAILPFLVKANAALSSGSQGAG